jgi:DNA-binding IclR family transcriptional regulator
MVRRAPSGRGYRLGLKLFELGSRALRQIDMREIARPHLHRLVGLHNETAHLGTLDADGTELVCIEKVDSPQAVRVGLWVGAKLALHATSSGKVVLAGLGDRRLNAYLQAPLRQFTDTTITDPAALRAELTRVRVLGHATDDGEFASGVSGVAAPVRDGGGHLVATVSVTAPTARLTARTRNHIARSVMETARTISRELGASPDQVER